MFIPPITLIAALLPGLSNAPVESTEPNTIPDMIWIEAGSFSMGSTDPLARSDESPVHQTQTDGFWIDRTEVTNAQFAQFINATDYITVAERAVDWEELKQQVAPGTPKPPEEMLVPGSLVFAPPKQAVDLTRFDLWWQWTPGACWKHPEGPQSSIDERENHPVVHIAYEDALAYAQWVGKDLPTETEWEFAARGGLDGAPFTWGNRQRTPKDCNIWDGAFPHNNTALDGHTNTAPVGSYPPNSYGLLDMAGNVWEWCTDPYRADAYSNSNPPDDAVPTTHRVVRGGSFLCSDEYCASYRPSARMPSAIDTGASHIGFRCVKRPLKND